jgi:hypothetical protein
MLTGYTPKPFERVECYYTDLLIYSGGYPGESLRPAKKETAKMRSIYAKE